MMRELLGFMVLSVALGAGQALAESTKVCLAHHDSSGGIQYTVQTVKNAEKHCTQHAGDQVVEVECCSSSTDLVETNVSFCSEDFDSGCPAED